MRELQRNAEEFESVEKFTGHMGGGIIHFIVLLIIEKVPTEKILLGTFLSLKNEICRQWLLYYGGYNEMDSRELYYR